MYPQPSYPRLPSATARSGNVRELVSLLTSLIVPLTLLTFCFSLWTTSPSGDMTALATVFSMLFMVLHYVVIPAAITAIVTGHVALFQAKKVHRALAHRWMALCGLLVGYLSMIALVVGISIGFVELLLALAQDG